MKDRYRYLRILASFIRKVRKTGIITPRITANINYCLETLNDRKVHWRENMEFIRQRTGRDILIISFIE